MSDLRAAAILDLIDTHDRFAAYGTCTPLGGAIRAALAQPAAPTLDEALRRLNAQPRWHDERTDQEVIAWRDVVSVIAAALAETDRLRASRQAVYDNAADIIETLKD